VYIPTRTETYDALFRAAAAGNQKLIRQWLRSAALLGLPETHREHFVLGFAVGRMFDEQP
jgi:hypothetical protein